MIWDLSCIGNLPHALLCLPDASACSVLYYQVAVLPISGCCTVLFCIVQSGSCAAFIRLLYGAVLYCTLG
jgi:hypothetical protein